MSVGNNVLYGNVLEGSTMYVGAGSVGSVRTRFAAPWPELPGAASALVALGKFDGGIEPTGATAVPCPAPGLTSLLPHTGQISDEQGVAMGWYTVVRHTGHTQTLLNVLDVDGVVPAVVWPIGGMLSGCPPVV